MDLDRILMAPEGDEGEGGALGHAEAFQSALATATEKNSADPPETQEPTPSGDPAGPPAGEPQVQAAPAPQAPPAPVSDGTEEYEIDGQKIRLTRAQAASYLSNALRILRQQQAEEGRRAQESQQAPQPQPQPRQLTPEVQAILEEYTKPLRQQIEALTEDMSTRQREKQISDLVDSAEKAMKTHDVFKNFEGRTRERLRGWIISEKLFNENASFETIAQEVGGIIGTQRQSGINTFVEGKIAAAGKRTDTTGGGAPATAPKKMGRKELLSGDLEDRVAAKYGV